MAKVSCPCFSVSASGSVGKTITFQTVRGRNICKGSYLKDWNGYYFKRKLPVSESIYQRAVRCVFSNAKDAWNSLPSFIKAEYAELAEGKPLTGYNIFINEYMKENLDFSDYTFAYLSAVCFGLINKAMSLRCEGLVMLGLFDECYD